ncbi:hypothetical protein [Natrialbaceae archaeon AArc-T1-2]|uniref:hypothetical protein n=1 Tax=Natrialbaceae archaeon AArc-T1-2 TaxID=3053904 RepID=UPI00255ADCDF|nr:hypothetical protein [Natrialbaceae archaeon AArc-T1-2]WIV65809.1 hypothetical protein QQ977_08840 [Natrialbaceae archaeon AArc-T1-2]
MSEQDSDDRIATVRERLEGASRREFLRTVGTGAYALGVAHALGAEEFLSAGSETIPVVTALVRDDPSDPTSITERTRPVPEDWYAAVTKAVELNDLLAQTPIAGYLGSTVVPGGYDSGSARISVEIVAEEFDRAIDTIGRLLEGIPHDVEVVETVEELEDGHEDVTPTFAETVSEPIPGGIGCQTDGDLATLAPALYHPTEGPCFATASHAYASIDDPRDEPLEVPILDRENEDLDQVEVARIRHDHPVEDVVVAAPVDGYEPDSRLDGAVTERVRGQFTRLGLATLVAEDEPLEKVGTMTGHTTGDIQGIDAVTCLTDEYCRRDQIRWGEEMDMTDGDSGSVSYHPDPEAIEDGVLIAGFNNARTWWPGQNYVWGTAAYRLTEKYGYHF